MSQPTLSTLGGTHGTNFTVEPHLTNPLMFTLKSHDGRITISVPSSMFTFLEVGQPITAFISMVAVKYIPGEDEVIEMPKLVGFEKRN